MHFIDLLKLKSYKYDQLFLRHLDNNARSGSDSLVDDFVSDSESEEKKTATTSQQIHAKNTVVTNKTYIASKVPDSKEKESYTTLHSNFPPIINYTKYNPTGRHLGEINKSATSQTLEIENRKRQTIQGRHSNFSEIFMIDREQFKPLRIFLYKQTYFDEPLTRLYCLKYENAFDKKTFPNKITMSNMGFNIIMENLLETEKIKVNGR